MAQHEIKVHLNNGAYSITPASTLANPGDTVNFQCENCTATICFSPTTSAFGSSINPPEGPSNSAVSIPSTAPSQTISMCATALNTSCTPGSGITATGGTTIKIGSGK